MDNTLTILAGASARQKIRQNGFRMEDIGLMIGASGGARCLALNQLDRFLFGHLLNDRADPLHLLFSSDESHSRSKRLASDLDRNENFLQRNCDL